MKKESFRIIEGYIWIIFLFFILFLCIHLLNSCYSCKLIQIYQSGAKSNRSLIIVNLQKINHNLSELFLVPGVIKLNSPGKLRASTSDVNPIGINILGHPLTTSPTVIPPQFLDETINESENGNQTDVSVLITYAGLPCGDSVGYLNLNDSDSVVPATNINGKTSFIISSSIHPVLYEKCKSVVVSHVL